MTTEQVTEQEVPAIVTIKVAEGYLVVGPMPPNTRLILAAEDVLATWGTRTPDGAALSVEWGEQRPEGWWDPRFTATDDGKVVVDRVEYERDKEQAWMYRDLNDDQESKD